MYNLVNIPHKDSRAEVESRVDGQTIRLVSYDKQASEGFRELGIDDFSIGDHMLMQPHALREMVGRALVHAIISARDVGYRMAQADIRDALGIKRT